MTGVHQTLTVSVSMCTTLLDRSPGKSSMYHDWNELYKQQQICSTGKMLNKQMNPREKNPEQKNKHRTRPLSTLTAATVPEGSVDMLPESTAIRQQQQPQSPSALNNGPPEAQSNKSTSEKSNRHALPAYTVFETPALHIISLAKQQQSKR